MIQQYNVDIIAIAEPIIRDTKIILLSYLEMPRTLSNGKSRGKLWILWKHTLQVDTINFDEQYCTIKIMHNSQVLYGYFVYVKCIVVRRKNLWVGLDNFGGNMNELWI